MSEKMNLNLDWRFHLGEEVGADFMGWDDSAWRVVTLPHDWSVEHPFDKCHASGTGYLPGGTAWYRKHFILPQDAAGKRVRVTFGGVYKHARVWVNSNYLGQRAYGYATFTHDVSAFVRPGENVICVRVEHNEVADSRWFTGSGIYRDVTLEITDPCSFETDGVFVTTEKVENGTAYVKVQYETLGADGAKFAVKKCCGCVVAETEVSGECGEAVLEIPEAMLWSPENPTLYRLVACAVKDGAVTDEQIIPFGVRTIRFDGDKGFFLNEENMKLKGVCVHHDAGALGAAVPKAVWARRLEKFKEMGCNAIRTAHNPPDSHLLDLCDEMGFLVMDEAFDEWEGAKNKWWQGHNVYPPKRFGYAEDFPQWYRADLEGMVKRDRNHPSIVIWSIGNEIDYPNDPYVTPLFREVLGNNDDNKPAAERMYDVRKPDAGRLAVVAQELTDIVHALDQTRPVTSALSFPELSNRTGYADVLDVVGYNYKEQFYEEDHAKYPGRVIYGSENGKNAKAWHAVRDNDYICGQFLWTGIDFLGECRGWPVRISQAGLMNLAAFPKAGFYQRKAMWTDEPFVKIAVGHEDDEWKGPESELFAWKDEDGRMMRVSCYSNAKAVELFLNGESLGVKEITDADEYRACWMVPYQAGELRAAADGAEDVLSTTGKAASIVLKADRDALKADGQSIAHVEVTLLDKEGRVASADDEEIIYQLLGDAEIIGIENGKPDDLTPYAERHRATFGGKALVYLRAGRTGGEIALHAFTRTGLRAVCTICQK
ncbi:MAG: DUF4982 domain-containing protein [Clostridia bacterium]|nr:DUF4982 domain-containing protein [Clostridia bacterium]